MKDHFEVRNNKITQTLNLTFLYFTISTLKPTVGLRFDVLPDFKLYKIAEWERKHRV